MLPTVSRDLGPNIGALRNDCCDGRLVEEFGEEIVDEESGEVKRAVLGAKAFEDGGRRLPRLNAIVWPAIAALVQQRVKAAGCSPFPRSK